jgi:hypothetical protein
MSKFVGTVAGSVMTSALVFLVMPATASAQDLSRYRNFEFGADVSAIAKQIGANPAQAMDVHLRPVLIQELEWHPQALGPSPHTESVSEVVFGFYGGELFRIAVTYDRYATEGLTANDFIEAISARYGVAEIPTPPADAARGPSGDQDEIVARWQDSRYRFDLIRSSYGAGYEMIGVLKRLEAPVKTAIAEAKLLDAQEAPQKDAARIAGEHEAERAKLEKARLVNKPKFRP